MIARRRGSAVTRRYAGHFSAVSRVRVATTSTHLAARRLGWADANVVEAYVAVDDLDALVVSCALAVGTDGAFLRATTMNLDVVTDLVAGGAVLAALDLAESLDVRERSARAEGLTDHWSPSVAERPTIDAPTPAGEWEHRGERRGDPRLCSRTRSGLSSAG